MLTEVVEGAGVKVALLEDQRVFRDSLAAVLEHSGYRICATCGRSQEAVDALASSPPDIFLVDLGRAVADGGGDDGWKTINFIREWYPHVRIVVLSGTRDPQDLERAQRMGVHGYLSKDDVSTAELLQSLARVTQGERVFPLAQFSLGPLARANVPEQPARLRSLTSRELEVLRYVGVGYDNLKIAACLNISERTVRAHVSNLYRKLGPENRTQLALLCREFGLTPPVS